MMSYKKLSYISVGLLAGLFSIAATAGTISELEFIGEATFPTGYLYQGIEVGGLSGIDYDALQQSYVAISDDRAQKGPARYYRLNIDLSDGALQEGDVVLTDMTEMIDHEGIPFEPAGVDPESVRLLPFPGLLYWTSEGDANAGIAPFVRVMSKQGQPLAEFTIPEKYTPTETAGIRNNLAFESLTFTPSKRYLYTATENALLQDGPSADTHQGSPSRVLKLDTQTGQPVKEYIYMTEPVAAEPIPVDAFKTNGLVELLAVSERQFIAVERAFSVGVGNSIKLFLVDVGRATNVLAIDSVADFTVTPMKKELLLDLASLGLPLDNIEGVTFGSTLPDGEKSLILVSDNNFNSNGQFTQFLAFKVVTEAPLE